MLVSRSFHAKRRFLCFIVAMLAGSLGGCSHLEFPELSTSPNPLPFRESFSDVRGVASTYSLQADDILIFRLSPGDGTSLIRFVADENGEKWIQQPVSQFRVRAGDVQGQALTVTGSGSAKPLFGGKVMSSGHAALIGVEWGKVQAAITPGLSVDIEPRTYPDLIAAGDVVEVTRRYSVSFAVMGDTSGGTPAPFIVQRTERFTLPVNERGYIAFPALTLPSNFIDADATPDDTGAPTTADVVNARTLRSRLATSQDIVRVADPNTSIFAQTSLETLAGCLSAGALLPPPKLAGGSSDPLGQCWRAGISPYFFPSSTQSATISNLVYSLSVKPRSWTLVDEEGARYELPMREGDSVPDAALIERQRVTGRPLFGSLVGHVYLVVVPRKTIASDIGRPFYLRVDKGLSPTVRYRVWPGDTVYVTRSLPKASPPGGLLP